MPSFDVVCRVDGQEVQNAVNNASKEIVNRYDFRDTSTEVSWSPDESVITISSNSDGRVTAAWDVLQTHLVRRGVSLVGLEPSEIKPTGGGGSKQEIHLQQGIPRETAKKIVKDIKQTKLKVQGSIQGDDVRFTGKKRDDLQAVIAKIKTVDYGLPLSFVNFREK